MWLEGIYSGRPDLAFCANEHSVWGHPFGDLELFSGEVSPDNPNHLNFDLKMDG